MFLLIKAPLEAPDHFHGTKNSRHVCDIPGNREPSRKAKIYLFFHNFDNKAAKHSD